ncbi:MAG: hypothetical protein J3K34DRAFT_12683 [Monoraphidium minutum]|nr:MAG: hypothetical protein J3K34DRAFT_12683 [Monoraphidium minutum]
MLDFNSLYPSIIQEYNICFTTVQRPPDGSIPPLPSVGGGGPGAAPAGGAAPLPMVIQGLVQERRKVKAQMKNAKGPADYQRLNIQQQAIKLTANSMYGCLGFTNSRFFARPLAELITSQGREILQSTVDLVAAMGNGLEVVYGDTDSMFVHTGTDDLAEARTFGANIRREVNKRYRLLEIELDAVYRTMLLLKKKKYAAIKIEPTASGGLTEVMEAKGLDIVRRDWCPLSKDAGGYALQQILSGQPKEDVVAAVHEYLRGVRRQLDDGAVPLGKFVITKQLTKRLEDYPDARAQPHVQVAMRRRAAGKREGTNPAAAGVGTSRSARSTLMSCGRTPPSPSTATTT